jgi:hypothetical protein
MLCGHRRHRRGPPAEKAARLPASTWHQDAGSQAPDVEQFVAHHGYQVTTEYEVSESAWESGKDGGEYRRTLK